MSSRVEIAVPTLTVERLLRLPNALVVDLRSPQEFSADHLPGAHNVPLFNDQERALIGFLYKQRSPESAFSRGRSATVRHIRQLVDRTGELANWHTGEEDLETRVQAMTAQGIEGLSSDLAATPVDHVPERPLILHFL